MNRLYARLGPIGMTVLVAVVIVALVPQVAGNDFRLYTLTLGAVYLVGVLGLNLTLAGGVISIGSAAFMMVGAYTVALSQTKYDLNPAVATVLAVLICSAAGLVTAFPALRLGPFAVAVVTLMYAEVAGSLILRFQSFTGGGAGVAAKRLDFGAHSMWYLTAGIAAVVYLGHRNLVRSPMGRALKTSRRSEPVAASLGIASARFKLASFSIYAGLAGLAGALYQMLNGVVAIETFDVNISITLLLMAVLGGEGTVTGPVLGAGVLTVIPMVLNQALSQGGAKREVLYGVILLIVVLLVPSGLSGIGSQISHRLRRSRPTRERAADAVAEAVGLPVAEAATVTATAPRGAGASRAVDLDALAAVVADQDAPADLDVRGVSKSIGGLQIVRDASFTVRGGTVHGLIGPNGSGKTTLLNCISGLTAVDAGEVRYGDRPLPPHAAQRARAGLGRTFQTVLLIEHTTVADNLLVGVDAHRRIPYPLYCLGLPPALRERRQSATEVARWAQALGLGPVLDRPVSSLTPRERRLVEIGRALATHPGIVLMDEPVAGLAGSEIDELVAVLRLLRRLGVTVVLVEHHAELVMDLCDTVTVIDVGEIITTDVPAKVGVDPRVVAAYLGDELVEARGAAAGSAAAPAAPGSVAP